MNTKEIHDLIKAIEKSNIAEFSIEKEDFSLRIRTNEYSKNSKQQVVTMAPPQAMPQQVAAPQAPVQPTTENTSSEEKKENSSVETAKNYVEFKSPMVGTFYRKPSPDKDVFVKVGDKINKGDVVCIIEAMKLFNEVESEMSGTIVKVLIDDQSPVEYDQALFLIDPA